jgi:hypothetical protein
MALRVREAKVKPVYGLSREFLDRKERFAPWESGAAGG